MPYVAWEEYDGSHFQVRVKRLEAGSWTAVGDSLNVSTSRDAGLASIASVGGIAYVASRESDGIARPDPREAARRLHLAGGRRLPQHLHQHERRLPEHHKRWRRALRRVAGERRNGRPDPGRAPRGIGVGPGGRVAQRLRDPGRRIGPRIASVGDLPYVVWPEDAASKNQIHVRRLAGGTWELVGDRLNVGDHFVGSPSITGIGNAALVTRGSSDHSQVHAKRFDGSSWVAIGGALNISTEFTAAYPSVATIGGVPYVSWDEYDSADVPPDPRQASRARHRRGERDADADRRDAGGPGR